MNLRSKGSTNLAPRVDNIKALERELGRQRREREKQAHLHRLGLEMERNPNQPEAQAGNGQGAANLRPRQPQRQARAIGTYDQPNINGNRLGIRAPPVTNNNFEIKSSLINMIENNKYHGLALEDPLDHLDRFDKSVACQKQMEFQRMLSSSDCFPSLWETRLTLGRKTSQVILSPLGMNARRPSSTSSSLLQGLPTLEIRSLVFNKEDLKDFQRHGRDSEATCLNVPTMATTMRAC
ncbi:hypothetical protein Bca4012_004929 [Brassica carinata]